jgi:hypothetical protein
VIYDPESPPVFGSVETLCQEIFRDYFAGQNITIETLYTEGMQTPIIVGRQDRRSGTLALHSNDDRFLLSAIVSVNTITMGPDADDDAAYLQEACRLALRRAQRLQLDIPNGGVINTLEVSTHPAKANDWQTATSVVQYASLPKEAVRFESIYRMLIRPPEQSTIINPFLPR